MRKEQAMRYIYGLDGLRAFAVLAVIAYHFEFSWASGGLLGVTVFFVLSGYLITNLLLNEWENTRKINLKRFWVHRFRRLLPAMYTMLFVVTAWVTLFEKNMLGQLREDFLAAVLYASNWWYIFQDLSYFEKMSNPSLLTHFWSLAVEEQFYLIWPLFIVIGLKCRFCKGVLLRLSMIALVVSGCAMAVLYNPAVDPSRLYYGTDTRAFSLLMGASLAFIWPSQKLSTNTPVKVRKRMDWIGVLALVILIISIVNTNQYDSILYNGGMVFISFVAMILIAVLVHPNSQLSRLMSFKPLVWIGQRSYGIYLWHFPVILLSSPQIDTGGIHLGRVGFQLGLTFLLAGLSYRFIENPIRKGAIGRFFRKYRAGEWKFRQVSHYRLFAFGCMMIILFVSTYGLAMQKDEPSLPIIEQVGSEGKESSLASAHINDKSKREIAETDNEESDTVVEDEDQNAASEELNDYKVTVIGDSVMIDVEPFLQEYFPSVVVDAEVGRQIYDANDVIMNLKQSGKLGSYVVIGLGANGAFTESQLQSLIDLIGEEAQILLINTRVPKNWENVVNETLEEFVEKNPTIHLMDWYQASMNHNEYFANDGVHLTKTGAAVYAELIFNEIK